MVQAVHKAEQMTRCPNCARFLYYPEHLLERERTHRVYGEARKVGIGRFTSPELRHDEQYGEFLRRSVIKSLNRCKTDHFDILLLHNPDEIGYTSTRVWQELAAIKDDGFTHQLGIAPGPANGFVLDLINTFREFGDDIDWCMAILNPLEPWPITHLLEEAEKHNIKIISRVADFGGMLFGTLDNEQDLSASYSNPNYDAKWATHAREKIMLLRPIAEKYNISMIQLAALWSLSQLPVKCVIPSIIREQDETSERFFEKIKELVELPNIKLDTQDVAAISLIGENTGCTPLKGASARHTISTKPDEWPMRPELIAIAEEIGWDPAW